MEMSFKTQSRCLGLDPEGPQVKAKVKQLGPGLHQEQGQ